MNWYFYIIIIILLIDLESKLNKVIKNQEIKSDDIKNSDFLLRNYLGKKVVLEIENDDIENEYLFSCGYETIGEIIDFDQEWFLFEYYNKGKKKTIKQYFRIKDLVSINEIVNEDVK